MIWKCAYCGGLREQRKYLCPDCWRRIPAVEKRKLNRSDSSSGVRLIELIRQLQTGVPPEEVKVSA